MPDVFKKVADYELQFGKTIHRSESVRQRAAAGTVYDEAIIDRQAAELALSEHYPAELVVVPEGKWELPAGAFRQCGGPI